MSRPMNVDDSKLAMKGYCPVSYHFGPPQMGDPKFASDYEGATYRFASAEGKAMFDKEPTKYAPQYGGWCGYGMCNRNLTPTDPLNFKFVGDDKMLVLFFRNDEMNTLDLWNKDEPGTKAGADDVWTNKKYKA